MIFIDPSAALCFAQGDKVIYNTRYPLAQAQVCDLGLWGWNIGYQIPTGTIGTGKEFRMMKVKTPRETWG